MRQKRAKNSISRHSARERTRKGHRPPVPALTILLCVLICAICTYWTVSDNKQITLPSNILGDYQLEALPTNADVPGLNERVIPSGEVSAANRLTQSNANETAWYLILVNRWNYIPDDYEVALTELANGQSVDKRIYPALKDMIDAAINNGVYPIVASGYRTAEKQQSLMDEKIANYKAQGYSAEEAISRAEAWVAIPGTSEHQLGIAVDINADGIHSAGHEVYEWLNKNAYRFGFICRYLPDKTEITGVIGEPWHYRYVGIEAATEIQNQGICLEEYLNKLN